MLSILVNIEYIGMSHFDNIKGQKENIMERSIIIIYNGGKVLYYEYNK